MARVPTVLALIANGIEQKLVAEGTEDDLIELPLHELVAVHLVHFVLAFANGTLTAETARSIERPFADVFLDCDDVELPI